MSTLTRLVSSLGAGVLLVSSLAACGSSESAAAGEYPSEDLEFTIAFGPGGGNDIMARTLVEIINAEDLYPGNIVIQNRDGGSGATGWGYLKSQEGDPYHVSVISSAILTTPLQADVGWDYQDFTHVGLFATDDMLLSVSKESNAETFEDWVSFANEEGSVKVGGLGTVGIDYTVQTMIAESAGYDIDYVPFEDEGQMQSALLSGAIDSIVTSPASIAGQVEAGEVNAVLFTGNKRLTSLPDIPLAEEKGIEGLPTIPRGFMLAPGVDDEVRDWWIDTLQTVAETDAWAEYVESNYLTTNELWGDDYVDFLTEMNTVLEETLTELGAI